MRSFFFSGFILAALLAAGCGSQASNKVAARNQTEYDLWFSQQAERLTPDRLRLLREAQQEIKLNIMAQTNATGEDAISDAFLTKVDGMTVDQFIRTGLKDRIQHLTGERDESKKLLDANNKITSRAGDDASALALQSRRDEDQQRLDKANADLEATRADLASLSQSPSSQ